MPRVSDASSSSPSRPVKPSCRDPPRPSDRPRGNALHTPGRSQSGDPPPLKRGRQASIQDAFASTPAFNPEFSQPVATFPEKGEVIDVEAEGLMEGEGGKEGDLMPPETQKTPAKVPETRATRKSGVEGEDWQQKGKRTDKMKAAVEVVEEEEEGPEEGGRFVPIHLHKVSA
ncbi:hypothetical protein Naga_101650g1 [Nannochloropsis gaditana]|uniref:Uncharacterized protein n=1 Tax=Nannochloropsis gaditana TaxID=72520 RepID=W7TR93_9STRA|nr:hypothetical protein Naga_101650g1 [Nannochloropsis gaditana]